MGLSLSHPQFLKGISLSLPRANYEISTLLLHFKCNGFLSYFNSNWKKKRLRGDLLLLSDIFNGSPTSKRASSKTADNRIKDFGKLKAPRGIHISMSPPSEFPPAAAPLQRPHLPRPHLQHLHLQLRIPYSIFCMTT